MSERVVITGANRGLGLELARVYAGRGDTVVAGCRSPGGAVELRQLTDDIHALDVALEDSIERFAALFGESPVDVLINNAGIDGRALGVPDDERDVLQLDGADFLTEIRVTLVQSGSFLRRDGSIHPW